jgi:hypothetical protein
MTIMFRIYSKLKSVGAAVLLTLGAVHALDAQEPLRVLRSNTPSIDVQDGTKLYKGYWTVSPGVDKDIYYAHRFTESTVVKFISDIDSIAFEVRPGRAYDFVILLNGKARCLTEISTIRTSAYRLPAHKGGVDEIPFTMGRDGRIYIEGNINGSPPLRFFFDNGADNTIVFPSAFKKGLKLPFDDSVANRGTGGVETRRTSNHAHLQICDLNWDNEWVMQVEKQLGDDADGTIGYDVFEDKAVEINFDRMMMMIRKSGSGSRSFAPFKMIMNGGEVPSIEATITVGKAQIRKSFLFDMGATGCLFLNDESARENHFYETLRVIGAGNRTGAGAASLRTKLAILPELRLGQYVLRDVPVNLALAASADKTEEVGMDVLKRFNMVLDFPSDTIYLKPNHLFDSAYRHP